MVIFFVVAVATPLELVVPVPTTAHVEPLFVDISNVYGIPTISVEFGEGTA